MYFVNSISSSHLVFKLVLEVSDLLKVLHLYPQPALLLQLPAGGLHDLLVPFHLPGKGVVPQTSSKPGLLKTQEDLTISLDDHTSEDLPTLGEKNVAAVKLCSNLITFFLSS